MTIINIVYAMFFILNFTTIYAFIPKRIYYKTSNCKYNKNNFIKMNINDDGYDNSITFRNYMVTIKLNNNTIKNTNNSNNNNKNNRTIKRLLYSDIMKRKREMYRRKFENIN